MRTLRSNYSSQKLFTSINNFYLYERYLIRCLPSKHSSLLPVSWTNMPCRKILQNVLSCVMQLPTIFSHKVKWELTRIYFQTSLKLSDNLALQCSSIYFIYLPNPVQCCKGEQCLWRAFKEQEVSYTLVRLPFHHSIINVLICFSEIKQIVVQWCNIRGFRMFVFYANFYSAAPQHSSDGNFSLTFIISNDLERLLVKSKLILYHLDGVPKS